MSNVVDLESARARRARNAWRSLIRRIWSFDSIDHDGGGGLESLASNGGPDRRGGRACARAAPESRPPHGPAAPRDPEASGPEALGTGELEDLEELGPDDVDELGACEECGCAPGECDSGCACASCARDSLS